VYDPKGTSSWEDRAEERVASHPLVRDGADRVNITVWGVQTSPDMVDRISQGAHNSTHDGFELRSLEESIWREDTEDNTGSKAEMRWLFTPWLLDMKRKAPLWLEMKHRETSQRERNHGITQDPKQCFVYTRSPGVFLITWQTTNKPGTYT